MRTNFYICATFQRMEPERQQPGSDFVPYSIRETSGLGWRGFLRAARPILREGYRVIGAITWCDDPRHADRDSAGD